MGDFTLAFKNINNLTDEKLTNLIKKSVFELTSAIISNTPVDTGRAKGNWQVSFNTPIGAKLEIDDKEGDTTISKAKGLIYGNKVPQIYWIQNNLDYINKLEYGLYPKPVKYGSRIKGVKKDNPIKYQVLSINGFSAKAPQGMVRINLLKFNNILKGNIK